MLFVFWMLFVTPGCISPRREHFESHRQELPEVHYDPLFVRCRGSMGGFLPQVNATLTQPEGDAMLGGP